MSINPSIRVHSHVSPPLHSSHFNDIHDFPKMAETSHTPVPHPISPENHSVYGVNCTTASPFQFQPFQSTYQSTTDYPTPVPISAPVVSQDAFLFQPQQWAFSNQDPIPKQDHSVTTHSVTPIHQDDWFSPLIESVPLNTSITQSHQQSQIESLQRQLEESKYLEEQYKIRMQQLMSIVDRQTKRILELREEVTVLRQGGPMSMASPP
ncbi:hypothetical protein J3Q64DRAFT_1033103 [Phycomyces blakesleeanus]|uniref:Uncharacterized protein n=2 Tax=Phycomyces blakesleeanus TaxID=4837 RepID=A0A167KHH4_PHYB8|nr:hypothetical protein PHYBLDRAFT_173602 [Phycomyces blakesleeanus NRRL 1555(-)]OAD68109.1 hypothetical protein PHYBLDRAFT_173602 [Phycomyces blakesleeanus NRRL 1555(-)]|eukprot:XP_018286149.1 hypothetical protein PHYBLDRAFT_173602 [Phycomyces blakesleeanus NRRL 1555(-)]